ncbi:hypothetical protein NKG05_21365 [Oerskovia sp. M15]
MTRSTQRRTIVALAAALTATGVVLSGCAAIPTSGPVMPGDAVVQGFKAPGLRARGPAAGDDPQQIVDGFLTAQAAARPATSTSPRSSSRAKDARGTRRRRCWSTTATST